MWTHSPPTYFSGITIVGFLTGKALGYGRFVCIRYSCFYILGTVFIGIVGIFRTLPHVLL